MSKIKLAVIGLAGIVSGSFLYGVGGEGDRDAGKKESLTKQNLTVDPADKLNSNFNKTPEVAGPESDADITLATDKPYPDDDPFFSTETQIPRLAKSESVKTTSGGQPIEVLPLPSTRNTQPNPLAVSESKRESPQFRFESEAPVAMRLFGLDEFSLDQAFQSSDGLTPKQLNGTWDVFSAKLPIQKIGNKTFDVADIEGVEQGPYFEDATLTAQNGVKLDRRTIYRRLEDQSLIAKSVTTGPSVLRIDYYLMLKTQSEF